MLIIELKIAGVERDEYLDAACVKSRCHWVRWRGLRDRDGALGWHCERELPRRTGFDHPRLLRCGMLSIALRTGDNMQDLWATDSEPEGVRCRLYGKSIRLLGDGHSGLGDEQRSREQHCTQEDCASQQATALVRFHRSTFVLSRSVKSGS